MSIKTESSPNLCLSFSETIEAIYAESLLRYEMKILGIGNPYPECGCHILNQTLQLIQRTNNAS